ncbi:MAG: DNA-binding protein [Ruminococcaceae bacterium]|nr:DNA-binding protein [Oscillospiraceae bacterium]
MKKNLTTGFLLDFYGALLTGRQREALDLYYNMDYSLGEIAAEFGVTRQGVHRLILQGEKRLLEMETVLGHAALYSAASKTLRAIREAEDGGAEEKAALRKAAQVLARQIERDANGI